MDDKTLVQLAAKAAGIELQGCACGDEDCDWQHDKDGARFDPLWADEDAFKLAAQLNMSISIGTRFCFANNSTEHYEYKEKDRRPYLRRAIVRAAAEIGNHTE